MRMPQGDGSIKFGMSKLDNGDRNMQEPQSMDDYKDEEEDEGEDDDDDDEDDDEDDDDDGSYIGENYEEVSNSQ